MTFRFGKKRNLSDEKEKRVNYSCIFKINFRPLTSSKKPQASERTIPSRVQGKVEFQSCPISDDTTEWRFTLNRKMMKRGDSPPKNNYF